MRRSARGNNALTLFMAFGIVCAASFCHSRGYAKEKVIYHHGVNVVKGAAIPKKEMDGLIANHPYPHFTVEQMKAMLLSLRVSKQHLIKKDIDQQQIFREEDATRFAPHLVQAFQVLDADEWVVLSMVQKRPMVVIRNDRLTFAYLWVEGDQLFVRFKKVSAKLSGDYESSNNHNRLVEESKGMHVTLEPGPGQTLSKRGANEIALAIHFDYAVAEQALAQSSPPPQDTVPPPPPRPLAPAAASSRSVKERLEELEGLKKDGLVTEQEYADMRKAILDSL